MTEQPDAMTNSTEIGSVAHFVSVISDLHEKSIHTLSPTVSSMTFYRGQGDTEWRLTPKLYREKLFDHESVLIAELMRIAPESFIGMSRFDTLVKMQHYGLPTRLLDMTRNPLVALFFACADETTRDSDGAVYVFPQLPVFRQENGAIRIILKYVFEYSGLELNIASFVDDIKNHSQWNTPHEIRYTDESKILHPLVKVPFYAVLPSMANERITCQDGAFMLFGMTAEEIRTSTNPGTLGRRYLKLGPLECPNDPASLWHTSKVYIIPSRLKTGILNDLSFMGVSNYKLFPELDYKTNYVTQLVFGKLTGSSLSTQNGNT